MSEEKTYEEQKEANKQAILEMGFEYGADSIPENVDNDPRVIKVNLPEHVEGPWTTRNGEGIWAYIRSEEDFAKYNAGNGTFDVVLMNHSMYYMGLLRWGAVIRVNANGRSMRPVLDKEWLDVQTTRVEAMYAEEARAAAEASGQFDVENLA